MTRQTMIPSLAAIASLALAGCASADGEAPSTSAQPVVGGLEAPRGAWPGTVGLYINGRQNCGGALITNEWVITAGHCVNTYYANGGVDRIVLGRHVASSTEGEERLVDRAYRHDSFSWMTLDADVGLLHLAEPSTMPTAKLLTPELVARVVDGAAVTVVGWGSTTEGGDPSDVLRQATMPILPNEQCRQYPHYGNINQDQICAGYVTGGHDACQGDSGGPLFMTIDGAPVQVGVISWGIGCARPNRPGIYTRLGSYLDWIWTTTRGAAGAPAPLAPATK
ncbi:MAG: serine protease [Labilithrix sp.]|nr:serine protease [Labilithrix sp.]MCW5816228.1 serine protease [Labilithrix sp.]